MLFDQVLGLLYAAEEELEEVRLAVGKLIQHIASGSASVLCRIASAISSPSVRLMRCCGSFGCAYHVGSRKAGSAVHFALTQKAIATEDVSSSVRLSDGKPHSGLDV